MAKKKLNKKSKKKVGLSCPYCGCTTLSKPDTKVKRFPKTHLFKFACGFAYLYNAKTDDIFTDVDWYCTKTMEPDNKDINWKRMKKSSAVYLRRNKKCGK